MKKTLRSKTKIYGVWRSMFQRCTNPNHIYYENYGGRGIDVCEEWKNSDTFITWAKSNGYKENLTIDRINNDLGYSPSNCHWATKKQQENNKRNNHLITIDGVTKNITQWSECSGIDKATLYSRSYSGFCPKKMLSPVRNARLISINGKTKTFKEWSDVSGIGRTTLIKRINHGCPPEKLLTPVGELRI